MLRVETSFQDTPGDGHYFVLIYNERPLSEQVEALDLKDGDTVLLWDPECESSALEAVLLFDFVHPMMPEPHLWAKAASENVP